MEALAGSVILAVSLVSVYHHMGLAQRQLAADQREAQALSLLAAGYAEAAGKLPSSDPGGAMWDSGYRVVFGSGVTAIRQRIQYGRFSNALESRNAQEVFVEVTYNNLNGRLQTLRTRGWLRP